MKKLLLVGAGDAHLYVLKQLRDHPLPDVEVTLLSPSRYQYFSQMFPGYAEGLYSVDEIRGDVKNLAEKAGAAWMEEAAMAVDPERKLILTEEGKLIEFDIVSFNIGSLTALTDIPGVIEHAKVLKPNYRIPDVMTEAQKAPKLVIAGEGSSAVEMALALHAHRTKEDPSFSTVLVAEHDILGQWGQRATQKIEKILSQRGIEVVKDAPVKKVLKDKLVTKADQILPFDTLVWLKGSKAQKLFANGGLPVDQEGFLLIEETLQVKKYPSILAAGSCASLSTHPGREKTGTASVQQAPVLWENIKGFLSDGNGRKYTPPAAAFSVLWTGSKTGLVLYNDWAFFGKWVWRLGANAWRRPDHLF